MVTTTEVRHPVPAARLIVAFDFDGTLTFTDSFIAFLRWRAGEIRFWWGLLSSLNEVLIYMSSRDRGRLKAKIARNVLGRLSRPDLAAAAAQFCHEKAESLLRPDALACWRDWREKEARLFIVTASPEILVAPFAAYLGAEGVIGSLMAFDGDSRLLGALTGRNCRGPEKVARLRAALGEDFILHAAYGDTDGDREMLAIAATAGMKVFGGRP